MVSCRQVDRDCDFLEHERIMDYSMLVGLHFREASCSESFRTSGARSAPGYISFKMNILDLVSNMNLSLNKCTHILQVMETLKMAEALVFLQGA